MQNRESIYELHDASLGQRLTLTVLTGIWLALAWWVLFGHGLALASAWFGSTWKPADPVRRAFMAAALSIYYVRLLCTWFVFLKRRVSWSEVFTIAPWLLCIYLLLVICAGTNPRTWDATGSFGLILFVAGSWMNSYSEYTRDHWKRRPENRGRLYTQGLFRYSRHPNYLGDLISFSGLCLISGRYVTGIIPGIMLLGFVFFNIPMLDSYLHKRYGVAFDDYAQRTRKLIPFVY